MKVSFLCYGLAQNGGNKVLFRVGELLRSRGVEVVYHVAEPERELPFPSECRFVFAEQTYPNALGRVRWLSTLKLDGDFAIATFHPTALALHLNRSPHPIKLYYVQAYEPDFYSDSIRHLIRRWPMMLVAATSYLLPLEKVVNCNGSRKGLSSRDRVLVPEIPPGIDLAVYHPRPRINRSLTIGHISRSEPWKGSIHFFEAMVRLRQRGYDFDVRVAYDHWRDTCGLEYDAAVPTNETQLAEYYAGVDVLVSTVTQKGFGLPPLEAMASGTLCVSTPIDFGRPGIDHIPIHPHSTSSIVEALAPILEGRPTDEFVRNGLQTARKFDWECIGVQWCELLEELKN